jgi:DNA polymerase-3 subunit epsilon
MLVEEFLRNDIDFDTKSRKFVDVQRIFHQMEPRTLSAAYKFYTGKPMINAHSAEADTLATLEVLCSQIERYDGVAIKDNKDQEYVPVKNDVEALHAFTSSIIVDFAQTMVLNDKKEIVFNFGKHKGKPVKEILKREPNYYDWMQNGDFALDTKRKLTEIKLKMMTE